MIRNCTTCKHELLTGCELPCVGCRAESMSSWESKETVCEDCETPRRGHTAQYDSMKKIAQSLLEKNIRRLNAVGMVTQEVEFLLDTIAREPHRADVVVFSALQEVVRKLKAI